MRRPLPLIELFEKVRIHLIVCMNQYVPGINHASPGYARIPGPELLAQLVGGLAYYFQIAAKCIRGHFVLHPMALGGDGVFENSFRAISNVNEIEYRVFHRMALEWNRLGKDAVADIGVKTSGLHQINRGGQKVAEVRLQPTKIEKIAAGFEVYQEVDIATRSVFTAGDRSENAHVRGAVKPGQGQNCGPLFGLESIEGHWRPPLVCNKPWPKKDGITVVLLRGDV